MNKQTELESKGQELAKLVDQGLDWLNATHNLNRANKMRMHDVRRNLRKITKVLRKKPVFAMYGASQVGKSYLAEIVLRGKKPDLFIRLGKDEVRFLEQINPPGGGAESGGGLAGGVDAALSSEGVSHGRRIQAIRNMLKQRGAAVLAQLRDADSGKAGDSLTLGEFRGALQQLGSEVSFSGIRRAQLANK
jgi:hypothetical protein